MIDTVIFDIGQVLAGFHWNDYLHEIMGELGISDKQVIAEVNYAIIGDGGKRWDEFDRGVMTYAEIVDSFVQVSPKYEREIRVLCDEKTIGRCMKHYDYSIPWVKSVKATGRRVLYLSNYMSPMISAAPTALDFLPYMDGGVFSCCVKLIKPDRAIYARLCNNYNLTPSHSVFIDDNARNIQAARDFGLNTIHFENYDQAHAELDALLKS